MTTVATWLYILAGPFSPAECEAAKAAIDPAVAEVILYECRGSVAPETAPVPVPRPDGGAK